MKTFNRDKYQFVGISQLPNEDGFFYTFKSVHPFYSSEIILVREAKLLYGNWGFVYFDEKDLSSSSCVNQGGSYVRDLDYNERKWRDRWTRLKVKLVQDDIGYVSAARCEVHGCTIPRNRMVL